MIQSMTAFARAQAQESWGNAVCEIRSVNHRYLELSIRLPDNLQILEASMRELARRYIHRGKIECYLRYQPSEAAGTVVKINQPIAKELGEALQSIIHLLPGSSAINPMDILRWPGVMQMAELDLEPIQKEIRKLLEKCLQDLMAVRLREGEELKQLFLQRLENMKTELAKVRQRMPTIYKEQRARLIARFTEAQLEMDSSRFEQEMVMFAQKIDVTEELERFDAHIAETRRVLKQGGVVGRRLDFLMQEMHREANTLGAKSVDVDTTRASVELKVLIEQIREQVQNVE